MSESLEEKGKGRPLTFQVVGERSVRGFWEAPEEPKTVFVLILSQQENINNIIVNNKCPDWQVSVETGLDTIKTWYKGIQQVSRYRSGYYK